MLTFAGRDAKVAGRDVIVDWSIFCDPTQPIHDNAKSLMLRNV